jgi:hypothetical protein
MIASRRRRRLQPLTPNATPALESRAAVLSGALAEAVMTASGPAGRVRRRRAMSLTTGEREARVRELFCVGRGA